MGFTALERLFATERVRQRLARSGGFSTPVMHEHGLPPESAPWLVTGATGKFLPTERTSEGMVRCGMFPCLLTEEDAVIMRMADALFHFGIPRCTSVQDAPFQPRSLLVSAALVGSAGADVEKAAEIMGLQGSIGSFGGVQVVVTRADVPVLLIGPRAGVYVRSGDHLGIILTAVDRSFAQVVT